MLSLDNYEHMDVNMLLSFVNTLLRDEFHSLEDLCRSYDLDREVLEKRLADAGFTYVGSLNQFR
jgi:hypothetical protein